MALHDFYEECRYLDVETAPDSRGGTIRRYKPGKSFVAGIYPVSSSTRESAGAIAPSTSYNIITDIGIPLTYGDVVQRVRDGLTLRVTSNASDMETPAVAVVKYHQVSAIKEGEWV